MEELGWPLHPSQRLRLWAHQTSPHARRQGAWSRRACARSCACSLRMRNNPGSQWRAPGPRGAWPRCLYWCARLQATPRTRGAARKSGFELHAHHLLRFLSWQPRRPHAASHTHPPQRWVARYQAIALVSSKRIKGRGCQRRRCFRRQCTCNHIDKQDK